MPRPTRPVLFRLMLALGLPLVVQGCQLSPPGGGGQSADVTPNPVTGGAIEVTALDDSQTAGSAVQTQASAAVTGPGPASSPQPAASAAPADTPASAPPPTAADMTLPEPVAEVPEIQKSEAQLACERRKGRWVPIGITGQLRTCVFSTGDAGRQCSRSSQCEGACLARSGTCAPFKPLIGCHEVLLDSGMRATECIE
ncbi:hypothetical protein [Tabrizicola sp. YIM 78059]|uniref:hypothetical protein n=1 Tax=Tabrizicola sp. YIM 78059 TaxID=2529861 RepID=UPI0010AAFFC1|nr:hypothetical protein [Tabrizicola sp. YIM 78059]